MGRASFPAAWAVLLLVAFGVRVALLDAQSLWADEGNTVVMAQRAVSQILHHTTGDIHPPLYYLLLHAWVGAAGATEFALRYLSVLFGVLLVALTARIGWELFRPSAGVFAALLAGLSPFLVSYSQEARMYAQMALFGTFSNYLCWRLFATWREELSSKGRDAPAVGPVGWRWLVGYVLATAAFLYTQYFSAAFLLFQNVAFLLLFWRPWRYRTAWLRWGVLQLALMLVYLPWLWRVRDQLASWHTSGEAVGAAAFLREVVLAFSLGRTWPAVGQLPWLGFFVILFLASGIWLWASEGDREKGLGRSLLPRFAWGFVLLWLAVPVLTLYLLSLRRPLYFPEALKLIIPAVPAYLLLLGAGAAALYGVLVQGGSRTWRNMPLLVQRGVGGVVFFGSLAVVGAAVGQSLWAYYLDSQFARDGYRNLVRYIELTSQPGDAIMLVASGQGEVFNYYYQGGLAQYPLPRQRPLNEGPTEGELAEIASRHHRLWAVLWGVEEADPTRFVERWLGQNAFRSFSRWYGNVELVQYVLPLAQAGETLEGEVGAEFGGVLRLVRYRVEAPQTAQVADLAFPEATGGQVLRLTLTWQAAQSMTQRYTVFAHLEDQEGRVWGQHDGEPLGGTGSTPDWQPGVSVQDRHGIPLAPATPPGVYQIAVGVYPTDRPQEPVPLVDRQGSAVGERAVFGPILIGRRDERGDTVQGSLEANFGGKVRLLGYRLLGAPLKGTSVVVQPGDTLQLTLFWQALGKMDQPYKVFTHLIDAAGYLWGQHDGEPAGGTRPTTLWQPGEVVPDRHGITVLPGTPPGRYQMEVGFYHRDSGVRLPVSDPGGRPLGDFVAFGAVEVERGDALPSREALFPQHRRSDAVGGLRLFGYDLTRLGVAEPENSFQTGDIAHLTLYWQADSSRIPNYIVKLWLQPDDGPALLLRQTPPVEGRYRTTSWVKDEIVRDQHKFALDVAPGRYTLLLELVPEGQKEGGGSRLGLQSLLIGAG